MSRFKQEIEKQRWIKEILNNEEKCVRSKTQESVDYSPGIQSSGYKKAEWGKEWQKGGLEQCGRSILNAGKRPAFTGQAGENRSGVQSRGIP